MRVVYKGDYCFNVSMDKGEVFDFNYQAGTIEEAKEFFLKIMENMFDSAVCIGLMEKDSLSVDVMDWHGAPLKADKDRVSVNDLSGEYRMPHVDIMRGVKGLNC